MTAKSLFNIILKVLGIYFIKDIIIALPTLFGVFYELANTGVSEAYTTFLISAGTLFIYGMVVYYLVFKTDWVMDRLKLMDKLPEDPIPLNIHRSTVISIVVLVVGLFLITQGIPYLVRGLAKWYQYNKMSRGLSDAIDSFDYSIIWVYAAEILIGLLFIGHQREIVNYIELKQRRGGSREMDEASEVTVSE